MQRNATKQRRLSPKQRLAIEALLSGCGLEEAARVASVDRVTLWRWLKSDDLFLAELRAASAGELQAASARLAGMVGSAGDTLAVIMVDGSERGAANRLRAADLVLTHAVKLAELVDLESRIKALEVG